MPKALIVNRTIDGILQQMLIPDNELGADPFVATLSLGRFQNLSTLQRKGKNNRNSTGSTCVNTSCLV